MQYAAAAAHCAQVLPYTGELAERGESAAFKVELISKSAGTPAVAADGIIRRAGLGVARAR